MKTCCNYLGAAKWRAERTDSRWYIRRYTKEEDSADLNLVEISSLCKTMKLQVSGKRKISKRCCKKNEDQKHIPVDFHGRNRRGTLTLAQIGANRAFSTAYLP